MSGVHADPARNGTVFGVATVTVDLEVGDCVVEAPGTRGPFPLPRRLHLHSLDAIQATYQVQFGRSATDPTSADVAEALKFAAQQLRNHQKGGCS